MSYLIERGKKRQARLQAAQDQTAVTTSQVADNERQLTFTVANLFVNVQLAESALELAELDSASFQKTLQISEVQYDAGGISEDDYLKMELQLLQFQQDESQARLARLQALSDLRNQIGYESVPYDYDVAGAFEYQPIRATLEDLQLKALQQRPDYRAAQQNVSAADSYGSGKLFACQRHQWRQLSREHRPEELSWAVSERGCDFERKATLSGDLVGLKIDWAVNPTA